MKKFFMPFSFKYSILFKKYKFIGIVLALNLILILAGYKETDAKIAENPSDIPTADKNKDNLLLAGNMKYNIKYIGHRGAESLAPENTLPSFEEAGKHGFWGAECDVHTTSDGNWMILHDDTVDRTTNGTGKIKNLTLEKLQSLNIDSGTNINQYKDLKVPRLEDYLQVCKKWGLTPVIEMKPEDNLQYYDKFIETIKSYGSIEKTVVISFSTRSLNELRKHDNSLTLGLLCTDITQENIDYVQALGNAFIDCSYIKITKDEVDLCHENNIKVGAWTVDDKNKADNLISYGVDYLTTDCVLQEAN